MNEVEIVVTSKDRTDFATIGAKARTSMHESLKSGLDEVDKTTTDKFTEIGDHSGRTLRERLDEHLKAWSTGVGDEIGGPLKDSFEHATEEIDVKVKTKFREVGDHGGKSLGQGLEGALAAVEKVGETAGKDLGNSFGKSLGDAGGMIKQAWIPLLIAALLPELPAIGALAATALVFAFGAGLAGLGLIAAFHLKSVQREFGSFKKFLGSFMKDIGRPFEETWATIFSVAGNVLKRFQPLLKGAFKDFIAPAVTSFVLRLGEAFLRLGPAIRPLSEAFAGLLGSIGKSLPGIFDGIAKALISMSKTISANPDLFGGFITGLLQIVVGGMKVIAFLSHLFDAFSKFAHTSNPFLLMAAALSPVLAILLHLGVAGKVFNAIGDAVKAVAPHISHFFDQLKKSAGPALKDIGNQIKTELVPAFVDFMHAAAPLAGKLIAIFTPAVVANIKDTIHFLSALVDLLSGFLKISSGMLSGNWGRMWDGMKDVAKGGAKIIKTAIDSLFDSITGGHGDKAIKITLSAIDRASAPARAAVSAVKRFVGKTVHLGISGASAVVSAVSKAIGMIRRFVGKTVHIGQSGASVAVSAVSRVISTIRRFVGKTVHVGVSGVPAAVAAVRRLISTISGLVSRVVNVGVNIVRHIIPGLAHGGIVGGQGLGHAAEGGPRSNLTLVGEQGAELVNLPTGSRVYPHGRSKQMLGQAGSDGPAVLEIHSGGSRLDDLLVEILRNAVRVRGGNVQVVLGK